MNFFAAQELGPFSGTPSVITRVMFLPRLIRTAAERLSRRSHFVARLPKDYGSRRIHLSAANQLGVLRPGAAKFEAYLFDFVERFVRKGDVVWDIGANMGFFAVPAAHKGAKVIAFEPDPFNQRLLAGTLRDNPDLDIEVVPVALSDRVGVASLRIANRGRSSNSLEGATQGSDMGGVRETIPVETWTADHALDRYPPPSFVKCDAEGAEAMILSGAKRLLETRPIIQIEMNAANAPQCREMLKDYRLSDALTGEEGGSPWEVLAVPKYPAAAPE